MDKPYWCIVCDRTTLYPHIHNNVMCTHPYTEEKKIQPTMNRYSTFQRVCGEWVQLMTVDASSHREAIEKCGEFTTLQEGRYMTVNLNKPSVTEWNVETKPIITVA